MAYRAGSFYIGEKLIPKYDPRKEQVVTGVYFNRTGSFEAWKDGRLLGRIKWRSGEKKLRAWLTKFEPGKKNDDTL